MVKLINIDSQVDHVDSTGPIKRTDNNRG